MHIRTHLTLSLIAAGILTACSTTPPQNPALTDARATYTTARSNPQVSQLAPLELKEAAETLDRAETALNRGDDEATINQLAYLTTQKVEIARETAERKQAELDIERASARRDQVRLEARTAEANAAKQRAEMAQQVAEQRAQALAAANAQSQRDQSLIAARAAELEEARRQAALAQQASDQHAVALAEANAEAARAQAMIDQQQQQLNTIKAQQAEAADRRARELAEANARAEQAQALLAQQEAELKELNAKKTERGMVITLGDVLFNVDKASLSAGGISNVKKLADFLKSHPERSVVVEGHTDSSGSASYNQALSEKRAEAVESELVEMGIQSGRIATRGFGESAPVANNETSAGRQMNRRVEIVLPDDPTTN